MEGKIDFAKYAALLKAKDSFRHLGRVNKIIGLTIEVEGLDASVGEICHILLEDGVPPVLGEVVGFRENKILLMPLGELRGIGPGCLVYATKGFFKVPMGEGLLGMILDGLGRPIEDRKVHFAEAYPVDNPPPNPLTRRRICDVIYTGVKSIDAFLTCGEGQRMGIFAGSGVGKSTLMGMVARYSQADVNVIALVGERGREVLDFIHGELGETGLAKSVVVCATSDQPALIRLKAAFVATAIAEYFREKGKKVLLMMDSVTRFAMAQREVGLAIGEPPTTKGYPPSVFSLLPKLLERSGMSDRGSITAFYTVLVEGDDMNDPIADTVRGILDGHIVLSRDLAARNHYPAIDILNSISRLMVDVVDKDHREMAGKIRDIMAVYKEFEDLISIGAYQRGSNPKVDEALKHIDRINLFLKQDKDERVGYEETIAQMFNLLT
jgi:flagellum-specific ATP synthase